MKVKRLVVGKGRTCRSGDAEEWKREYYEVEAIIEDPEELEVAKANITGLLDGWLSASKPAVTPAKIPQLDPDESAKLPWKNYRTKQPCKPDEAGWIFRNTPRADVLAELIERQGNGARVQIGRCTFEVKFSGSEHQFIGRAPVKK
jgi:hypothetical protein